MCSSEEDFELPADQAADARVLRGRPDPEAYIEPVAVGDVLPDMPIFLKPGIHVPAPLEATYRAAWDVLPRPAQATARDSAIGRNRSMTDRSGSSPRPLENSPTIFGSWPASRLDPRLRGRLDPSDVVQQTLLIAHEKQEQFRGRTDAELAAWLRTILVNILAQQMRRFRNFTAGTGPVAPSGPRRSSARLEAYLGRHDSTPGRKADPRRAMIRLVTALARVAGRPEDGPGAPSSAGLDGPRRRPADGEDRRFRHGSPVSWG